MIWSRWAKRNFLAWPVVHLLPVGHPPSPCSSQSRAMLAVKKPTDRKVAYAQLRKHLLYFGGWVVAIRLAPFLLDELQTLRTK